MIVGVNKMDAINYAEESYTQIKDVLSEFLKKIGYDPDKILFVPISGWVGDNML